VQCWNCLGEFEAVAAVWCGCATIKPTKICPFCMTCSCAADPVYRDHFWESAPDSLEAEVAGLGRARQRLGDLMLLEGAITQEQLEAALQRKETTNERLGEALVGIGAIDAATLEAYLRRHQGSVAADLQKISINPELIQRVGVDRCYEKVLLPLELHDLGKSQILTLAMADTSDSATVEEIARHMACRVIAEFAEKGEILEILRNTFPREEGGSGAPTAREARRMLFDWVAAAVKGRATHIHMQSERVELRVFLRIDGVVFLVKRYPKKYHPYLMREVRSLVHHPEGQPFARGRTHVKVGGKRYQLTIVVHRSEHGEDVAVRVMDTESFGRDLQSEVPDPRVRVAFAEALGGPGLVLVSSPLYHGRLDTAYALMWTEKEAGRRPRSFERQVMCPLPGVEQVEISPASLPATLAALPGEDPVFLFDLVSDGNLEAILKKAVRRPVVATVKAKGVVPLLGWLMSRIEGEELSQVLRLVTNQRQVRLLCKACRVRDEEALTGVYLGLDREEESEPLHAMTGVGCEACDGRGFKGRTTLYEFLPIKGAIATLMTTSVPAEVLLQEGAQKGGTSLRISFLEAIRAGAISLAEFEKVSL